MFVVGGDRKFKLGR